MLACIRFAEQQTSRAGIMGPVSTCVPLRTRNLVVQRSSYINALVEAPLVAYAVNRRAPI